ncbi:2OG-Fe(II) oxygenase superfamily protein [Calycina marina]|uniref:2OG-Fe(II) oxygenase superfamily protein n=1 Tax=Calycina marina TaxID=1763456 RepID=A0A9P7Z0U5_9HELO|nr:2OG-Fe(II) oxygenase superfamily protein [Calycina marina]
MSILTYYFARFALLSLVLGADRQQPILNDECSHPAYTVHIVATSPLVIYISDFLTNAEREHLLEVTKGTFSNSAVADSSGAQGLQQTRTSKSTSVAPDSVVDCIVSRALSFQSPSLHPSHVEPLQLVAYSQNQSYHFHTDWFTNPSLASPSHGGNRISSFFVYVDVAPGTTGGGTNFPVLNAPHGEEWCKTVDCDAQWEDGLTFRPVSGNAIFWMNMVDEGGEMVGDERTLHAGLPVTSGSKVGMNIWTREGSLGSEYRGV